MDKSNFTSLRCAVHFTQISESGVEEVKLINGSGIHVSPGLPLTSLAAEVLNDMYEKKEIDGKIIMKADIAKGIIHLNPIFVFNVCSCQVNFFCGDWLSNLIVFLKNNFLANTWKSKSYRHSF